MSDKREQSVQEVDLQEVGRLVDELERDLERIPPGSADIQRLKDEVRTLKNVLESPIRREHWVRDGLHSIRESAVAQGVKSGQYIREIGRILGLP